jgi:adenylate cyclase
LYAKALYSLINDTIVGLVGVSDTKFLESVLPSIIQAEIPLIPIPGSTTLFKFYRNVINARPSYFDETAAMVQFLLNTIIARKIAIAYQDFAGGTDAFLQYLKILNGVSIPSFGNFIMTNTSDIVSACTTITLSKIEAVIVVTKTYQYASQLINCVRGKKENVVFIAYALIDNYMLASSLTSTSNVYMSQIAPQLTDTTFSIVKSFLIYLNSTYTQFVATQAYLFVYIQGKLVTSVLGNMVDSKINNVSPDEFLKSFYATGKFSIGGVNLGAYSDACHATALNTSAHTCCNAGARSVYITKLNNDGTLAPIQTIGYDTCLVDLSTVTIPIVFGRSIASCENDTYAAGIDSIFDAINREEGIQNRYLKLITLCHGGNTTLMLQHLQVS